MKFIIATGGTGGHLFPALRVAEELKREGHEILFLGSFRRGQDHIQKSGFLFEDLGSKGFISVPWHKKCGAILAMGKAFGKSCRALKKHSPDAVIGFGGYGAFPVVLAAALMRYPAMIHEQNVIPGRANKILSHFVRKIAVSFDKSRSFFNPKKTVLTGCPAHAPGQEPDRQAILDRFQLKEGKTTILVFGGSQGSRRINEVFVEALSVLIHQRDLQVIHISGGHDHQKLQKAYNLLGIPFALFEFLDRMEEAYTVADLVISRSGAVTVNEVANFHLPAVFIPYPYVEGHQKENALVLCEAQAAQMIEDWELTPVTLIEAIVRGLDSRPDRNRFKDVCIPDATQKLAREALKIL